MKVGITGASGFVGGAIGHAFEKAGWTVVPFGRRETSHYDLSEEVRADALVGLDAIVHAAYAVEVDNVAALVRLRNAARDAAVPTFTFISSFAASADAASAYGRGKFDAEQLVDAATGIIVRPGLVAGAGGLYGAMRRAILRLGVAPIFGDGEQPVYLVDACELARAVVALVSNRARGAYACASGEPIAFRELCCAIAAAAGKRVACMGVPIRAALALTAGLERLGIHPPITSESVRGIANLRQVLVPAYPEIGFAFSLPAETIRRVEAALA